VDKRIKILSVIDGLGFAGDESRLLSLAKNLDHDRFEHSVLTVNPQAYTRANEFEARREQYRGAGLKVDDLSEVAPERGGDWQILPKKLYTKAGVLRRARRLASVVRKWKVGVLDGHLESAGLVSVLAGRMTGAPASITLYCGGWVENDNSVWPRTTRLALRLASGVLTDSQIRANEMKALIPKRKSKVFVIPNGIPRPQSNRSSAEMRRVLGLPEDPRIRVVGMLGRLTEYKGQDVLLRAAQKVLQQEPETAFLAVGYTRDERYKSTLKRLAEDLGIANRVVITEYPGEIGDVWQAIDIHAHASLFDSLPISIAEGMSLGKPAVVTSAGGIPEIVKDRETGIVVPPGDANALSAGILELLRQPRLAQTLGWNARERYELMYRPEVMARAMEMYFCGLVTRS
jgi:L-malate glycosyltransferase